MTGIGELIAGAAGKLFNLFKVGAAAIVARVLAAFGLTLVTFNGVLPGLKAFVQGYIDVLPQSAMDFLGAIGIGVFFSMVLSALAVRLAWKVLVIPTSVAASLPGGAS